VQFSPWNPQKGAGKGARNQVQSRKGGGRGVGAKGGAEAAWGKGQGGPKPLGLQPRQKGTGGKGAAPKGAGGGDNHSITYSKAKSNPLSRAEYWRDQAVDLFGPDSAQAADAEKAYVAAKTEAESRRTPAEKAVALRQDRNSYIDAIASKVRRT
jgi:hypothetical protein